MNKLKQSLFLSIAASIAATSLSSLTHADGYYAAAQLGYSQQLTDSEAFGSNIAQDPDFPASFDAGDGGLAAIALGYSVNKNLRFEARLAHRQASFNDTQYGQGLRDGEQYILDGELDITSFSIESFYDFANSSAITPYLKAGVGVADNSYAARLGGQGVAGFDAFDGHTDGYYDNYADGDSTNLTWNIGAGAEYQINESISAYAEYQYAQFGDIQTGQDSFTDGFEVDSIATSELAIGLKFNF